MFVIAAETLLLDNAKNGFVVKTADAIYGDPSVDLSQRIRFMARLVRPVAAGGSASALVCFFGSWSALAMTLLSGLSAMLAVIIAPPLPVVRRFHNTQKIPPSW
jgi:hypothetical protein